MTQCEVSAVQAGLGLKKKEIPSPDPPDDTPIVVLMLNQDLSSARREWRSLSIVIRFM